MVSVPEESVSRTIDESGGMRVSVVIPAHNEAQNLQYVLPQIPGWVHEIILVNDHSTDETVDVAKKLLPTIQVVHTAGRFCCSLRRHYRDDGRRWFERPGRTATIRQSIDGWSLPCERLAFHWHWWEL